MDIEIVYHLTVSALAEKYAMYEPATYGAGNNAKNRLTKKQT